MTIKVGINGFGRIGRIVARIIEERRYEQKTNLGLVAINDLSPTEDLAYLFKYDSVHGRFGGHIETDNNSLIINKQNIKTYAQKDPEKLPWAEHGVDVVLEATGRFLDPDKAQAHISAGAKKVLLSAPAKGKPDATICYGVNNNMFASHMKIISTASCTTNCIAPIAKIIHEKIGIEKSSVTTIHSYTNDQRILDLAHKDKRRSRAAALSLIPTTTGAAKAISLVLPELEGRFQGMAIRVPTPNVSLIDMVCVVKEKTTKEKVNNMLKEASTGELKNILGYSEEPIVSVDINGTSCSSIVDSLCTDVVDGNLVKILSWYDNEWGFANRAVDLLELMGQ